MQKNFPEDNWRNNRPMLAEITDNLNQRRSFIETEGK